MHGASLTQRRERLRAVFARKEVTLPASVFDTVSARLAAGLGYECGVFAGTIAAHVVLGAPDLVVLTLSELTDQVRRIERGCDLPLIIDADHGYGNALNVMRTVEELETAGAGALFVEDTVLPRRYGEPVGELIPVEEFRDKLRAAVSARVDPTMIVIGRTGGLGRDGIKGAVARVKAATEAGVDAVFCLGVSKREEVETIHNATPLPQLLQDPVAGMDDMAQFGVRAVVPSHLPYYAAMRAVYDCYKHLREGGARKDLLERAASAEMVSGMLEAAEYAAYADDFMGVDENDAAAWLRGTSLHSLRG